MRSRDTDPVPVIPITATFGVFVADSATLRRLRIESNVASGVGLFTASSSTMERVFVKTAAAGQQACSLQGTNVVMRDSVCWNSVTGRCASPVAAPAPASTSPSPCET